MRKILCIFLLLSLPGFGQELAHYRFNNDTIDYTGNGYALTSYNYAGTILYRQGKSNNAIETDRATNKYLRNASINQSTGPITISCWVNPYELVSAGITEMAIVDAGTGTKYTQDVIMLKYNSSTAKICYYHGRRGSSATYIYNPVAYSINTWYHVVITFSGTATGYMTLYVNGAPVATGTSAGLGTTSAITGMYVGCHDPGVVPFSGLIDELVVEYSIWSPARIKNEYMKLKHPL